MQRLVRALAFCMVAILVMGAADTQTRFNDLGHEMMCTCGCGQVLLECNHLGCPSMSRESAELKTALDRGDTDNTILVAFQNEYGPTVLAAPMLTRFSIVAWVMPPLLLALGILLTVVLVRRWRLRAAAMPVPVRSPQFQAVREKIRKETEL